MCTRAVEKKARSIPGDYERKIRELGAADGRVLHAYRSYGDIRCLVGGAFGEFNDDYKKVMRLLAESKIRTQMKHFPVAGGQALQCVRRVLSIGLWRSQSRLLRAGLDVTGPGGAEAHARRNAAKVAYDDGMRDFQAQHDEQFCGGGGGRGLVSGDGRGSRGW